MLLAAQHLRHVLALGEHRHYARAAEALYITQPALTRSIQVLEEVLNARLFDRGRGAVEPTPIGLMVIAYARDAEMRAHDLFRAVALAKGAELGKLRVGAGPLAGAALIGPVVGRISVLHPRLRVEVVVAPWEELSLRLRSRNIDLMLTDLSQAETMDDLEMVRLQRHPVVLVARSGHPLLQKVPADPAEWLAYPWAGPRTPAPSARALARQIPFAGALGQRRGELLNVVCDSHAVLQDVLVGSNAIAAVCVFMVAEALRQRRLAILPVPPLGDYGSFGIARLSARSRSAPEVAFEQMLQAWDTEVLVEEQRLLKLAQRRRRSRKSATAGSPAS